MKRLSVVVLSLFLLMGYSSGKKNKEQSYVLHNKHKLYKDMGLEDIVNYKAFRQTIRGYNKIVRGHNGIEVKRKEIITLIDFTKPSTDERFYVMDVKKKLLLFSTYVSHGKNSGENYATSFSNKVGSFQSSLGFYLTETTYQGKNGNSLLLEGLEEGINDKAKERAIVIHGADYSNPSVIDYSNRLGRSLGCPALPREVTDSIIDVIKDGSILYIFADRKDYVDKSDISIE